MLHIIVHHRDDPRQPWPNNWIDSDRVDAITTTKEIGQDCKLAAQRGDPVRFHRCSYGAFGALVCAEARVASVEALDKGTCLVRFEGHTLLQESPRIIPQQGMKSYKA